MSKDFKSLSINDEPSISKGIFTKQGSYLTIELDSNMYVKEFISLMKRNVKIKSISFFGEEQESFHYAGDFVISRIVDNEVVLYKA